MRDATLCLLIRENENGKELLLAMKKRGFGAGKWNMAGGKIDYDKGDKNFVDAAIRETTEEIGVRVRNLEQVAVLDFRFCHAPELDQIVYVFIAEDWEGELKESEEMLPQWFKFEQIPLEQMWGGDKYWLPMVLAGNKLNARIVFKEGDIVAEHKIEIVELI